MNGGDSRIFEEGRFVGDELHGQAHHSDSALSDEARQEFNRVVFRFEDAWQAEHRPDIAAFLPAEPFLRLAVLRELVRIDFEYRGERWV